MNRNTGRTFPSHHDHAAARLLKAYDQEGEDAMLDLAHQLGRPLDERSLIFPDLSMVRSHADGVHSFHEKDGHPARVRVVERPASKRISNPDPYPDQQVHPHLEQAQGLATYGLLALYREFSQECYGAGFRSDLTEYAEIKQSFERWLERRISDNRHLGPASPRRYVDYEEAAIPSMQMIWNRVAVAVHEQAEG